MRTTPLKPCLKCKELKPLDEFYKNKRMKDGLHNWCKLCKSEGTSKWYRSDPAIKKRMLKQNEARRQAAREFVLNYLLEHPCVDCREDDPIVLEFDHQFDKTMEVGRLMNGGYSQERILEEIEKCEVVCANCHRRRTAKSFNWYKEILK